MTVDVDELVRLLGLRDVARARLSWCVFCALHDAPETGLPAALQARVDIELEPGMCVVERVDGSTLLLTLIDDDECLRELRRDGRT